MDAIIEHLRTRQPPKLVIYFQGGLNSEDAGIGAVESMLPLFEEAGAHPVTFVWETGVGETLRSNPGNVNRTKLR